MPDKSDYRLYLEEKFNSLNTHINAQFENVHERLDGLNDRMDIANGRTTKNTDKLLELEIKELQHVMECPAMPKIDAINKTLEDVNFFMRHPKLFIIGITVAVLITLFSVVDLVPKAKIAKELMQYKQEQIQETNSLRQSIDSLKTR